MSTTASLSNMSLKQLNEMNSKAQKLCELMKQGIVEFMFRKKSTGKMRKAHGTLKRDLIPPEAQRKRGRPKKRPEDLVIYYDTDKKAIRSFKDYLLQKVLKKPVSISKTSKDVKSISSEKSKQTSIDNNKTLAKKHEVKEKK